ncbi:hypothetical protein BSL82_10175 [Tardibacter chloracetimidivorans]|uniref:DUF2833 domain-containing protein n=1 Tax=Tardibacter chloracetimidivorans TaxID=1921510 RepID=A0A1L3ZVN3_9SPHN|nr:hypothetical protein [Tardibacter chloracetimidivorans]API59639.1 hypothetical protein BSL82_10175 [Tardibacter chloracetimidivorans]
MADLVFRPVRKEDAAALAANLRPSDEAEIVAAAGAAPVITIARSLALSTYATAVDRDGELMALYGVAPLSLLGDVGTPWLLATPQLARHARPLTRTARQYVVDALRFYPVLQNYVDVRNTASIRFLSRLGFTLFDPEPYGAAGLPFRKFEMRRV